MPAASYFKYSGKGTSLNYSSEQFHRDSIIPWNKGWILGCHYRTNKFSINNNYDTSYTFFRERARRPKVEISLAREVYRIGFRVIVQRNGISRPSATCNGIQYNLEKQNHDGEGTYLHVNTPYFVYPFGINQEPSKGAYIVQWDSRRRGTNQFDVTPIQVSIRISGEGFEMEKEYNLKSNLVDLREKRLDPNENIRPETIIFSLEEIKEPSRWDKLKSSFSIRRTPISK